jgi:hypothetical protein
VSALDAAEEEGVDEEPSLESPPSLHALSTSAPTRPAAAAAIRTCRRDTVREGRVKVAEVTGSSQAVAVGGHAPGRETERPQQATSSTPWPHGERL